MGLSAVVHDAIFVRALHAEPSDRDELIFVHVILNIGGVFLAVFAVAADLVFLEFLGLFLGGEALVWLCLLRFWGVCLDPGLKQRFFELIHKVKE